MNWMRVRWLFQRELKDQLRDRRTMFTIFCLPLMLYPLMGLLMMQMAQLRTPRVLKVAILQSDALPDSLTEYLKQETVPTNTEANSDNSKTSEGPKVESDAKIAEQAKAINLVDDRGNQASWNLVETETLSPESLATIQTYLGDDAGSRDDAEAASSTERKSEKELLAALQVDAVLLASNPKDEVKFSVVADLAAESSQLACIHVEQTIQKWKERQIANELVRSGIDAKVLKSAPIATVDVAEAGQKQTILWAKILPLIMFVWALTGAFYPAIDLCAGEKERGTLETLLSGPATRREIVFGKLFAVICFSVLTAVLNLMSMQITIGVVSKHFAGMGASSVAMGPLSLWAIGWLLVMLLPISILFSSVALAIAALARSSKEGQYYLMPLLVIGMPLVMLPMMPGIRLSIGTSMFPVAGAILLARTLVEGQYSQAVLFAPMVVLVTGVSCWLATRWAVRQFESESVLFRETDRFDMAAWLQHLWRDRAEVASPSMAALCAALILIGLFYARLQGGVPELTWNYVARSTIATQLAMILAPCLIMAIFLTTSIRKALRLHRVPLLSLPAAVLIAFCMHPSYVYLAQWIQREFPFSADTQAALAGVDSLLSGAPLVGLLLTLAVIPAICEELAFRGFIFAGLQHNKGAVRAIVVTSLLFGLSHGVLQQSISATLMGFILGLIAWRSGSVVCGIIIHICHNSLSMLFVKAASTWEKTPSVLQPFIEQTTDGFQYTSNWQAISSVVAICLLYYFLRDTSAKKSTVDRPAVLLSREQVTALSATN